MSTLYVLVSWFGKRSKRKVCTHQRWKHRSLMCAQVTRQVSLLGLIAWEQGRKLVNTFLLHILCCIGLCAYLPYKLSIICHPGYNYYVHTYVGSYMVWFQREWFTYDPNDVFIKAMQTLYCIYGVPCDMGVWVWGMRICSQWCGYQ